MKQQIFEEQNAQLWAEIDSAIIACNEKKIQFKFWKKKSESSETKISPEILSNFPANYRALCQHLATAKSRGYTSALINRLNDLVLASHHVLYRKKVYSQNKLLMFFAKDFPKSIRQNAIYVLVSSLFFLIPLFLFGIGCYLNEELIYSQMDSSAVRNFETMYNPENEVLGPERNATDDITMFGHYIQNNIGIGFRTFALGLVGGIGTLFILIYNGLAIGAVAGHLTLVGYTDSFYGFVVGHAAFELTAIVLCGAAGLKVGMSIVNPRALSRIDALKLASKEAVVIVYGSALMLLIAAFIEAFWSSNSAIPLAIKYGFGASMAIMLIVYFCFAGRRHESQ